MFRPPVLFRVIDVESRARWKYLGEGHKSSGSQAHRSNLRAPSDWIDWPVEFISIRQQVAVKVHLYFLV